MSSNDIKEREKLYKLIISQLIYDGLNVAANYLGNIVGIEVNKIIPGCNLLRAIKSYNNLSINNDNIENEEINDDNIRYKFNNYKLKLGRLNFDEEFVGTSTPPIMEYISQYLATHKAPVTYATFTKDGKILATGSEDKSIKIIEIEKITLKNHDKISNDKLLQSTSITSEDTSKHPVTKTLYEHFESISCLEFHPTLPILASGGLDKCIQFSDYVKTSIRKSFKTINEIETINCMSFHPSGDYLSVVVLHPTIRLYDVNTLACYSTSQPNNQHLSLINSIKYDNTGRSFITSSNDGTIKFWDALTNKSYYTITHAHKGLPVYSACYNSSCQYVLSSSIDGVCLLWDTRTYNILQTYIGRPLSYNQPEIPAFFNHSDDFLIYSDDQNTYGCWNSRTGEKVGSMQILQNSFIKWAAHSPTDPILVSCCNDFKIRIHFFGD